jgi:hypothetical protein
LIAVANELNDATAANESRTKSRAYSVKSWPSSSFHNRCSSLLASFPVGFSFFASGPGQQQPLHLSFSGRRYLSGLIRA